MRTRSHKIARRNFFSRTAEIAAWTLASRAFVRADAAPRAVGLGFSLYGMKTMEIAAALKALAEIGYDCVELPVMSGWPADSAQLAPPARRDLLAQLAERGLRLTSLMENLPALGDDTQHRSNLERLKRAAELARDLAPQNPAPGKPARPLIETILGGKPDDFGAVKHRLADRLHDWASIATSAQIVVAIKAHVSNVTQRPEQLLWLLGQVASPWLQAAYDYSHFQLQGLDLGETMNALLPKSAFIHIKDTEHAQGKRGFLLPGEGTIDYLQLFRRLKDFDYRGDVIVEVSSQVFNRPNYDPLKAASQCYNHLADAFSKSGLPRA